MAQVAYITTAGQAAIADAQFYGYKIDLVRFKIGDTLITETDPAVIRTYTTLPGTIVYDSGNNPNDGTLTYQVSLDTGIVITIYLNSSIGDFTLGSAGLYLSDGTLFAILKLTDTYEKIKNNGNIVGNTVAFPFVFVLTLQDVLELSILAESVASLPIVADETELPPFQTAPYSNYFIQNYAGSGQSAIACRFADEWQFCLASKNELFEGWLKVAAADFDSGIVNGDVVYYDVTTEKWSLLDGLGIEQGTIGIRQGDGVRFASFFYSPGSFLPGTAYYADTYPSLGKLTTLATKQYIGSAITDSTLSLKPEYFDDEVVEVSEATSFYQAALDISNVYRLTNLQGVYPESYTDGLTIQFVVPATSISGQQLAIGPLDPIKITQKDVTSGTPVSIGRLPAGALVTLTYLDIDEGFRADVPEEPEAVGLKYLGRLNTVLGVTLTLEQAIGSGSSYEFRFVGIIPTTDGMFLGAEISTTNGSTWDQSLYLQGKTWGTTSDAGGRYTDKTTGITIAGRDGDGNTGINNQLPAGGLNGSFFIHNPSSTSSWKAMSWDVVYREYSPFNYVGKIEGYGSWYGNHTLAVNKIRFRIVQPNSTTSGGTFGGGYIDVWERPA